MLSNKTGFRYPLTPKGEVSLLDFATDPSQRIAGDDADVVFHDAEAEDVLPFKPQRVLGGWYFTILYNHRGSKPQVIHGFEEE